MPVAALLFCAGPFVLPLVFYQTAQIIQIFELVYVFHRSSFAHAPAFWPLRLMLVTRYFTLSLDISQISFEEHGLKNIKLVETEKALTNVANLARIALFIIFV
jgi:hypothetical protein